MAQDTPQTPVSPELEALQREVQRAKLEQELAEARKKIAEAERAEFDAQLPKTTTKGPEGNVTVQTGAGYFAELLAYRTLNGTASKIADLIEDKVNGKTVILTDQLDLTANDALWQLIDAKLKDFDSRFDAAFQRFPLKADGSVDLVNVEAIPAALLAAPAILGAAADIAAFFRVNREMTARAVTLSNRALLAEMAKAILAKQHPVVILSLRTGVSERLVTRLSALQEKRRKLASTREKVRGQIKPDPTLLERLGNDLVARRAELTKLEKDGAQAQQIAAVRTAIQDLEQKQFDEQRKIARFKRVTDELDPLIQEFNALETTLTSRATGQAESPLEAVAAIDLIRSLAEQDQGRVLSVSVVSQGAEIEITKTAWTSGRISYVGGSVVSFFLTDAKGGTLLTSGAMPAHLSESFKGRNGPGALDN